MHPDMLPDKKKVILDGIGWDGRGAVWREGWGVYISSSN